MHFLSSRPSSFLGKTILAISGIFFVFSAMMLAYSPYVFSVQKVKINILFATFQFLALFSPSLVFLTMILIAAIIQDILSGAPTGFYILIYSLSLVPVVYFIRKNIYFLNLLIFFTYLIVTGILKLVIEFILLMKIYEPSHIYFFLIKTGIKEFFLNVFFGLCLYFLFSLLRQIMYLLRSLMLKLRTLN